MLGPLIPPFVGWLSSHTTRPVPAQSLFHSLQANPDDAEYQIIVCKDGKCAGGKLSQHISATNTTQPIAAAAERLKRRLDNAVQTVSQLSHQRR